MKNMKIISKVISIIILAFVLTSFFSTVFAVDTSFKPDGWNSVEGNKFKTDDVQNFSASIINVVAIIGSAAAIITLIVLGIKYMMGSAEEKAEYKKTLLPYIIGAAMVFGASVIVGVVYNIMNQ